jgi:hypothetical protein
MKKVILLGACLFGLTNISAFADTCSQAKSGCFSTGGDVKTCERRYNNCVYTGCSIGWLTRRFLLEKK